MGNDWKPYEPDEWHKLCSDFELEHRNEHRGLDDRATTMESGKHTNITPGKKREVEPNFFFMMNCLVYSRMETGHHSNRDYYDEDVNVYLASLLTSFMNPEYHRRAKKYLSKYDSSLFEKIRNSTDARLKYTIYKTNADFLLISIGIFKESMNASGELGNIFRNSEEASIGRGKAYYQFAYTYSQSMFRKPAAISDILEKLSRGFERYVEVLTHMRGEYFNILDRLSNGEIYHLERSVDRYTADKELKKLQDEFLDTYSRYMKEKTPELKKKLRGVVKKIRLLDESFRFSIDD